MHLFESLILLAGHLFKDGGNIIRIHLVYKKEQFKSSNGTTMNYILLHTRDRRMGGYLKPLKMASHCLSRMEMQAVGVLYLQKVMFTLIGFGPCCSR